MGLGYYQHKVEPYTIEEIQRILQGCDLATYVGRRDYTLISLAINTGISLHEIAGLQVDDVTEKYLLLRRGIHLPLLGDKVKRTLAGYMCVRTALGAEESALFLHGQSLQALTERQIGWYIGRRCRKVRDKETVPHTFDALRLHFVQRWISAGGSVDDLRPIFEDSRGHRRLLEVVCPTRNHESRGMTRQERLAYLHRIKKDVVRWYLTEGLSLKEIYRRHKIPTRAATAALELAGFKVRSLSEAAQMRFARERDGGPVGRRLLEIGTRAWQQEERCGTELLQLLAERTTMTLPEVLTQGFSRRQYMHARKWLSQRGFVIYQRSTNVSLTVTDAGLEYRARMAAPEGADPG